MADTRTIVAALSGGVDSATAAAMLVDAGHRVVGMTMRLYDAAGTVASAGGRCCGPRDIEDARRVCAHLGIPFYVVDLEDAFREAVIDDFVDSYLRGETPNPCVRCNQHIKFSPLLSRARALGATAVATGHYARIARGGDGHLRLRRGADASKDQSYFLFSMPTDELESIQFPLGDLDKDQVRERAVAYDLPNAHKKDSQEICFVPDGDYAGFVETASARRGRSLPMAGDIVDTDGNVLAQHGGIHKFTVGQRRGLGDVSSGGKPVYVLRIDAANHRVVVGPRAEAPRRSLRVSDARWFGPEPSSPVQVDVQVRYRARPAPATVCPAGSGATIEFDDQPQIASPGQAAVFYRGDTVLGGGWISPF